MFTVKILTFNLHKWGRICPLSLIKLIFYKIKRSTLFKWIKPDLESLQHNHHNDNMYFKITWHMKNQENLTREKSQGEKNQQP